MVEDRIADTLHPRRIERRTPSVEDRSAEPEERLVTDTRILADDILNTLRSKLFPGRERNNMLEHILRKHIMEMRRALNESEEEFLRYLDENLASVKPEMQQILRARGENLMMLSLRLAESHSF
ncbi:hypothetical protein EU520_01145 [Candidatus Thorarchaeota archaeon]|nr:MAG: hypothetical protein EU520_01145 [Candidatus Thorarchaeota archaeon]